MRYVIAALAVLVGCAALAGPPYDVTANITAPPDGGPVDTYTLVLDGADVGPVNLGTNTFPGLLTVDGVYVFEVRATNTAGSTLSDPVTVMVSDLPPPGKPGLSITVTCAPSCVVTVSP